MPLMVAALGQTPGDAQGSAPATGRTGLDIGLVNNMPDAALKATERQFARLLASACGTTDVRLHLFSLGSVARAPRPAPLWRGATATSPPSSGRGSTG